ncbi:MAG: hypothetical protein JOZ52_04180 [Acidobacteria bacterium]|nr:hypothetical protein [Acidobacteriota bacterium]
MGFVLIGLGSLFILIAAICQIMVLVKLFQTEGAGKGILGLICNIYLLIWGFMNAQRLNLMKLMIGWVVCGLLGGALLAGGIIMSGMSMQQMNMNSNTSQVTGQHHTHQA